MPLSHAFIICSFLLCVKVYSMVLLNIHLKVGFILLSKKQKKTEQCWNMAYDCLFFPSSWQEFSCSDEIENGRSTQLAYLLPLINLRKAWQEDLKSTHVARLSAVLQACVEEYLFNLYRVGKKSEFKNGLPFSSWAGTWSGHIIRDAELGFEWEWQLEDLLNCNSQSHNQDLFLSNTTMGTTKT